MSLGGENAGDGGGSIMEEVQSRRAPMHLWIVGILSLLWNAFGAYDYLMTRLHNMEYLGSMGMDANDVLAYVDSFPLYAQFGWGLGVWGAVLGSILLLMRNRHAVLAFGASLLGAVLSIGYQIMGPSAPAEMSEGGMGIMPWVIIAVAVALFYYAHRQKQAGVLR
jgi:hypothetical protein